MIEINIRSRIYLILVAGIFGGKKNVAIQRDVSPWLQNYKNAREWTFIDSAPYIYFIQMQHYFMDINWSDVNFRHEKKKKNSYH